MAKVTRNLYKVSFVTPSNNVINDYHIFSDKELARSRVNDESKLKFPVRFFKFENLGVAKFLRASESVGFNVDIYEVNGEEFTRFKDGSSGSENTPLLGIVGPYVEGETIL